MTLEYTVGFRNRSNSRQSCQNQRVRKIFHSSTVQTAGVDVRMRLAYSASPTQLPAPPFFHVSAKPVIQLRRPSNLNPLITSVSCSAAAARLQAPTTTTSNRTHLSNLNELLSKRQALGSSGDEKPSISQQIDFSGVLPAARKTEEMSPRSLHYLQCLLSDIPRPSPRRRIADKWREFHGSEDWSGLLDPLDEDLRRELVRYGELVQVAYRAFFSTPAEPEGTPNPKITLTRVGSYRVTRHLHATASLCLPELLGRKFPGWMSQRSSWIGYVAVCDCPQEISRLGRRDIVIALRGTATCLEWAENFRNTLVDVDSADAGNTTDRPNATTAVPAKVAKGFLSLYKTKSPETGLSLSDEVLEEVRRIVALYPNEPLSITITGHSLGAALALLVADKLSSTAHSPPIAVFSFGGPRVGNRAFAERLAAGGAKVLRVVNKHDVVTQVPGVLVSEKTDRRLRVRLAPLAEMVGPWVYWHAGTELRVDSRQSPYLKPDADMGCCHDLEAYLHLVDGFLGSSRPFRANAKRSILKLLYEQTAASEVKKLYTSSKAAGPAAQAVRAHDGLVGLNPLPVTANSIGPDARTERFRQGQNNRDFR